MAKTIQTISVAIQGLPDTGKRSLSTNLELREHYSARHKSHFRVLVNRGLPAQATIIVFDASTPSTFSRLMLEERVQNLPFCVVATKPDLLTSQHYSNDENYYRFAYYHRAPYFPVNNLTGQGIDRLVQFLVDEVCPLPLLKPSLRCWLEAYIRSFYGCVLDTVAACFRLPSPRVAKKVFSLPHLGTDRDVLNLLQTPAVMDWDQDLQRRLKAKGIFGGVPTHRITPHLIVKEPTPSERAAMEYIRQNTTIPVPRLYCDNLSWLVMEYIEGQMLYECWDSLSVFRRFQIACTLRMYVKEMRVLTSQRVGDVNKGIVDGVVFDQKERGPFNDLEQFRRFCDLASVVGWQSARVRADPSAPTRPPISDGDWTPVFTHGDLNTTNIILDSDGAVWLVDWGSAGFYPASIEAMAMKFVDGDGGPGDRMPASWASYRRFIVGHVSKSESLFWKYFTSVVYRF